MSEATDAAANPAAAVPAAPDAALAAAAAELSAPDAILEPSVLFSLSAYLAAAGGGAKAAKKAVKLLGTGYKGRGDMLRLLGDWSVQAGVATHASVAADLQTAVQRAVAQRFDASVADSVLEHSQPPWLEALVADPAWEEPLLRMQRKAPNSLFLRLCVSLMAEHRREQAEGVKIEPGAGNGGLSKSGATPTHTRPLLSASLRAACLHDFDQFNSLLTAILRGIIDKCAEKGALKRKRQGAEATPAPDSTDEVALRVHAMELDALVQDFLRLSAQSEWSYLYAQRALQGALANAPRAASFLLTRLSQDLTHYATHPPPPPASLLQAAGVEVAPSKNASVYPLDLLLRGIKDEWNDVLQVWHVLCRTESLSPLDIGKLYARFAGNVADPPPVPLLRHKLLLRTLLTGLFSPTSALMTSSQEPARAAAAAGTGGKPHSAVPDREKYAYLLAYACCIKDERICNVQLQRHSQSVAANGAQAADGAAGLAAAAAASIEKGSFDETFAALLRFHSLASNKAWGLRPSTLLRCLHEHLSLPLFACAAVYWLHSQLVDVSFWDSTYHSTVLPFFLNILGELANRHPLLRRQVFAAVAATFHLNPSSLDGFQLIQLKKLLLNLLLHLLHLGTNLSEVMGLVAAEVPRGMDHSLVRHFVVQMLWTTGPPYSRAFLEHTLQILALPQTFKALQSTMLAALQAAKTTTPATPAHPAVLQVLAQAHVPANTPAARRLILAAELHGQLPAGTTAAEIESGAAADPATMTDVQQHLPVSALEPSAESHIRGDLVDGDLPAAKRSRVSPSTVPSPLTVPSPSAPSPTPGSGSNAAPGSKAARREEKERLKRAAAEAEARRKAEMLRRLMHTVPKEPRPLTQLTQAADVRDGSESSVLDFVTLLHLHPDILRLSPVSAGLLVSDEGVVTADQCSDERGSSQPMDDSKMQTYMHTVAQYVNCA